MRNFKSIKALIVCVTIIAAMLLGGCASESTADTSSKAANDITSASVSDASVEASIDVSDDSTDTSKTSDDVNDESDNLSADVSDNLSADVSDESKDTPTEPTEEGLNAYNEIIEYIIGVGACNYNISYEQFADKSEGLQSLLVIKINTNSDYDSSIDSGTYWQYMGFDDTGEDVFVNCCIWEAVWLEGEFDRTEYMLIPPDEPTMVALCEKLGVASNNLSALKFTPEDIKSMDAETASLLLDVFNTTKIYTSYETPEGTKNDLNAEDISSEVKTYTFEEFLELTSSK